MQLQGIALAHARSLMRELNAIARELEELEAFEIEDACGSDAEASRMLADIAKRQDAVSEQIDALLGHA